MISVVSEGGGGAHLRESLRILERGLFVEERREERIDLSWLKSR